MHINSLAALKGHHTPYELRATDLATASPYIPGYAAQQQINHACNAFLERRGLTHRTSHLSFERK